MIRSIRTSLILGTTLGTVAVLLVAGLYVYYGVRSALWEQFDRTLRDDAAMVTSMTEIYASKLNIDFEGLDLNDFETSGSTYLQMWFEGSRVVYRSASLEDNDLDEFGGMFEDPEFRLVRLDDRVGLRAVGITFIPTAGVDDGYGEDDALDPAKAVIELDDDFRGRELTLVLARSTDSIDALLARLQILLTSLGAIAAGVAAATLWIIIRRNLRPLDSLARSIANLRGTDLATRIDLPRVPTEIQPVVDRLNELLQRIDAAMQRERSFSAHVAHELRTPVSALRSTMEVACSRPRKAEDHEASTRECLAIVCEMQDMVESLLYLFRLEAGQVEAKSDPVELRELVLECWAHLQETAQARRLCTEFDTPSATMVSSDRGLLGLAIRNMLENAVVHSDEGGTVRVDIRSVNGDVDFQVRNSGSRITPDRVPHLFDRFWRGDESRSSTGTHNGLGLTVVKKVADVLGSPLQVDSTNGEFQISLSLKRTPTTSSENA